MILKWGRKGLIAGALAVTFVTPSTAPPTTYIHKAQYRPDIKLEFRHITPSADVVVEADLHTPGYYGVDGVIKRKKKEEDEIIALIMAMYDTGTLN